MKYRLIISFMFLGMAVWTASCNKDKINIENPGNFGDTSGTLKEAAAQDGFPVGMAIDYNDFMNNATYASVVKSNCNQVTFGNLMKEEYLQQDDGSIDFTRADALLNAVTSAGLGVYGHNLIWYQQQNAAYLNKVAGTSGGTTVANLITNGDLETWNGSTPAGWAVYNHTNGDVAQGSGGANVHGGSYSLAVTMTSQTSPAQANWRVQIASPSFNVISGHTYLISFYIKSPTSGSLYQLEGRWPNGGVSYSGDHATPPNWSLETFSFTAGATGATVFTFDMGASPNGTTYIDDVTVTDQTAAQQNSTPTAIAHRLDSVMHRYITAVVSHYAGKVKAWDVVNELFTDDGSIRNNTNTPNSKNDPHWFVWSQYLGKSVGEKAFEYAHAADPDALLFINEYGLETHPAKLDSLIAYVKDLRSKGVHIDGIGTQMHVAWNTPPAGIDEMFQKLAATGLKIRISEMDVSINPFSKSDIGSTPLNLFFAYQAAQYKYVVESYLKNIPKEQRYGITVWGVHDPDSWLYDNGNDYPLLFNADFGKKPAYSGFLQGLQGQ